ncbi:MAG: DUF1573 domain-containing protein [Porphyromonas sp.]|nr:DUF1573 domain-containing protein [Porphyromonas sp.]
MKKILYLISLMLFFTGSIVAQTNNAEISAKVTEHDFGTIKEANGKVHHEFTVINSGKSPLVITRVVASCGCTTPEYEQEPIAPGKTGKIKVTYNPAGRPGPFVKTIAVYSNGKDGAFTLKIKGKVE